MSTEPRASSALRLSLMATKVRSKVVFVALDGAVIITAYFLALVITLHNRAPANYFVKLIPLLSVALVVQLVANRLFGLYGRIWSTPASKRPATSPWRCLVTLVILLVLYPIGFGCHLTRVPLR